MLLKANQSSPRLYEDGWTELQVFEHGENLNSRQQWFNATASYPTESLLIQVSGTHVFILGGTVPSLVAREYDVM